MSQRTSNLSGCVCVFTEGEKREDCGMGVSRVKLAASLNYIYTTTFSFDQFDIHITFISCAYRIIIIYYSILFTITTLINVEPI